LRLEGRMNATCAARIPRGLIWLPLLLLAPAKAQTESGDSTNVVARNLGVDLLAAAQAGQVDRIQELLGKGADMESKDEHGRTPLMVATVAGQLPAVKLLLDKGSDLSARNIHRADAFDFAVSNDRAEIVAELIGRGIDLEERGGPALRAAARNGQMATAEVLVTLGVDVDSKDDSSRTPLIAAVDGRQRMMVAFLIEHGADVNAADNAGTALSHSLVGPWGRDTKIVKMLKKAGARK